MKRDPKNSRRPNDGAANLAMLKRTVKKLFSYYPVLAPVTFACILFSAIVTSIPSLFVQNVIQVIEKWYVSRDWVSAKAELIPILSLLISLYVLSIIAILVYKQLMAYMTQGFLDKLRQEMFGGMQDLPIRYFDTHQHGDIMSFYTNDIDTLRQLVSEAIPAFIQSGAIVLAVFGIMLYFSIWLTLISVLGVILMIVVTKRVGGGSAKFFLRQQQAVAKTEGYIQETMTGQKVVKVFCHEQRSIEEFDKINDALIEDSYRAHAYASVLGPIIGNIGNFLYVALALVGGVLLLIGVPNLSLSGKALDISILVPFLNMTKQFTGNINQLSQQINSIVMAGAGAQRVFSLIDEKAETDDGFVTLVDANIAPDGTIFINLMFCIVVPLVFCSLSSSIACMKSPKRAGRIMGTTLLVFIVTGLIAAVIMLFAMRLYPPVLEPWADAAAGAVDEQASVAQLLVNFFTVEDFAALLSRRAMLPLIVFSILIGFGVNLSGGADCLTAKVLQDMTNCLLKVVSLISYYAPVAFFGFFASLVATYGAQITAAYGRAMLVYYPLCFVYALVAFPLYAYLGGGKEGVRVMRRHILRPAVTALGTCSSVATIPTNLEAAEDSGVPRDISDLVLPLGATMHMDGSCFSCVLKIAFLFGVFGIPFEGAGLIVKILLVAVFSSVAMSGIPGGGYIGEYIICTLFFPAQMAIAYPIAVTIGNLVDPPATMINSAGDYVVSFLVARFTEGKDWLERAQREKAAH